MPQKFLPSVFAIWHGQQLVAAFGPARRCALLLRLLASIDVLVQVVNSYNDILHQVFGRRRQGKKEKPEKAADWRYADNHDLVGASLQPFSDPF